MTRGAALAPLLVEAMTGAEIDAPPIVTHRGMVTTYRSHDQMMAAFAADMATGKWECDDEDWRRVAAWQAARTRRAPQPCQMRRPRSRTSHRRVTCGRSARPSTKGGSSDPDGSSSEPPRSRHLAIWGALDVGDILERAPAPTPRSASAPIRSHMTKRGRSAAYAAVAELDPGYVFPAVSGSGLVGGETTTRGDEGRRRCHATSVDDWAADIGIVRAMSKDEIAELAIGPLDFQDRHAACGYEVTPSTLALERGQMLAGVLDGYGPSEDDGTPTLTIRRPAGSMWIVVPLKIAQRCERRIGTEVVVRRRPDGSYVVEPRRDGRTDSRITRRQVIADGRAQRVELERALRRDDVWTCRSSSRRCSTRRASRRHVGSRRGAAKKASADPDGEPPRYRPPPTVGGASSPDNLEPPRRHASSGREVTALALEVCR